MVLRKYEETDAKEILKWIDNEKDFRLWSADRYNSYPVSPEDINNNYTECSELSNFYPLSLVDNEKLVGHLILRNPGENKEVFRLGFIIIDNTIRGKGYGKKLILEALNYARQNFNAKIFNLGVFTNNTNAIECYKSCGFKVTRTEKNAYQFYNENWDCAEMILE